MASRCSLSNGLAKKGTPSGGETRIPALTTMIGRSGRSLRSRAISPDTVESGHVQVGDDEIGGVPRDYLQRGQAVGRGEHRIALVLEEEGQRVADGRIVVDHQDGLHGCVPSPEVSSVLCGRVDGALHVLGRCSSVVELPLDLSRCASTSAGATSPRRSRRRSTAR